MELENKQAKVIDENGNVVNTIMLDKNEDPAAFNAVWDDEINSIRLSDLIRFERDRILAEEIDPVVTNPLRYDSLTQEEKAAYATYRQALLDITNQPDFPDNVDWPILAV